MEASIESIQQIEAINASDTEAIKQTAIPSVVIPKSSTVHSLENLMYNPARFRANFNTNLIAEFASYSEANLTDQSSIYIDAEKMQAQAIFDQGTHDNPRWADHKAQLSLQKTAEFLSLLTHSNTSLYQLDLIDFFNDWREHIDFYDDIEIITPFAVAINAIRKLTVKQSQESTSEMNDFKNNRSALESIEVSAGQHAIPNYFAFSCEPYNELPARVFNCKIRAVVKTDQKDVKLKFRIEGLEKQEQMISNDFKEKMIDELPENTKIYIATMDI